MPPTHAQIDIHRPDRTPAERDAGGGAVVGEGIDDLARVLDASVDDFDRRNHVFCGAQHVGEADTRAFEPLAHDEGELDLDPRLAVVGVRHFGAVADHLVVEDVAVVRLVDHRGALHRLGGQADLVADELAALLQLALHHVGGDRVGVFDRDVGKGDVQRWRLFMLLGRLDQNVRGFLAIGIGEHGSFPRLVWAICSGSREKIKSPGSAAGAVRMAWTRPINMAAAVRDPRPPRHWPGPRAIDRPAVRSDG